MIIEKKIQDRSGYKCELCTSSYEVSIYDVLPVTEHSADRSLMVCKNCLDQIEHPEKIDTNHWRCLSDSMWSEVPAVQVIAWRMLDKLKVEGWASNLLEMLYLDEEKLAWAQAGAELISGDDTIKHIDSNGVLLQSGDTVVLIKDLNVKGTTFTAKRGTSVKGITLVYDNAEQIEGRVSGQQIVLLTKYVKKSA